MAPMKRQEAHQQADEHSPKKERLYEDIDPDQQCTEIESLCMQCGQNGMTRLLLTRIPHFREVILMAFECPHCGYRNNEIQPAGTIQEFGVHFTCKINSKRDLDRQIVKTESATIRFEELDFEIPANTQRGLLNTVEGFLMKAIEDLSANQEQRKEIDLNVYQQVQSVIDQLQMYINGKVFPFTVSVDDPAGNSYIENLCAPSHDPQMIIRHYRRTAEQATAIGLDAELDAQMDHQPITVAGDSVADSNEVGKDEVFSFPANCSSCQAPCDTRMKIVEIPYFKEVVLMSTTCDACGYKSNEVKSGGAVSPQGIRITLKVTDSDDLSRDVLKSESCGLSIPELELELDSGTLGGKFTTIEGLLSNIHDELAEKSPFARGDSKETEQVSRLDKFLEKLKTAIKVEMPYTLILDDPLGNSHLQNPYAPDADPNMTIEEYERTYEQNEFLGLNDMKTEDY